MGGEDDALEVAEQVAAGASFAVGARSCVVRVSAWVWLGDLIGQSVRRAAEKVSDYLRVCGQITCTHESRGRHRKKRGGGGHERGSPRAAISDQEARGGQRNRFTVRLRAAFFKKNGHYVRSQGEYESEHNILTSRLGSALAITLARDEGPAAPAATIPLWLSTRDTHARS